MNTQISYLDSDHNVVDPEDAEIIVTTEVNSNDETVSQTWEELDSDNPSLDEMRPAFLAALRPVFVGLLLLVTALGTSIVGGSLPITFALGIMGLGLAVWGISRLM